ncbi:MAG: putative regulator of Ras-like GTPase activity (Roadblock/LC7/MglB family) [Planctomycetota bacterium]|jgi:predicted regulator of Ras-like GTPase activity (Roadblock/LC7/MglB family)
MANPFNQVLDKLLKDTDAEGAIILSTDGLSIASELIDSRDEDRIAAMSATILSLGKKFAAELDRGNLEQLYIKGDLGYILFKGISDFAVLGIIVSNDTRLGLLFLQMKNAAEEIENLM